MITRPAFRRLVRSAAALAVLAAFATHRCSAQDGAGTSWSSGLSLHAFVSTSYGYNLQNPASRMNVLRVYDVEDRNFSVDDVQVAVEHAADKEGDVGFSLRVAAGSSVPRVTHSIGWSAADIDLQQAYVSCRLPFGARLDAGKFFTPMGYEVIDGYDGYNDNATRSFLFGYAVPSTHTGVRLSGPLTERLSFAALVVNGWDNMIDSNTSKSVGLQLAAQPAAGFAVSVQGMVGPERGTNEHDARTVVDLTATYASGDAVTFGLNADYGTERHADPSGADAVWRGAAIYVRARLADRWALSLRAETFDDANGVRTGTVQRLAEVTLTPEYRFSEHLVLRADLRLDTSDVAVFDDGGTPGKRQTTALLNFVCAF